MGIQGNRYYFTTVEKPILLSPILFLFSSEGITNTWLKPYFLFGAILSSWWICQQFKRKLVQTTKHIGCLMAGI